MGNPAPRDKRLEDWEGALGGDRGSRKDGPVGHYLQSRAQSCRRLSEAKPRIPGPSPVGLPWATPVSKESGLLPSDSVTWGFHGAPTNKGAQTHP